MKSEQSVSKTVWVVSLLTLAGTGFLIWNHFRPAKSPAPNQTPAIVEHAEAPTPAMSASTEATSEVQPVANTQISSSPPVIPIPLAPVAVNAENGSWLRDKDYLLAPHTTQDFGGVTFLMDSLIQLQGRQSKEWKKYSYRETISIPLKITNTVASIHLLGGTRYGSDSVKCAELVWHYADGSSQRTPIEHGNHFRDWVRMPYEQPAHVPYFFSKVVWASAQATHPGQWVRLYRATLANPSPNKIPIRLEFVSAMEEPTLFLCGVTLDPLKVGERPDNSPDFEPADSAPAKSIQIIVTDSAGQPLPESRLQVLYQKNNYARSTSNLKTGGSGIADVNYPPDDLQRLEISAIHDGFAGRQVAWEVQSEIVPASYTLKLVPDVTIGGVIVDSSDNPIPGATVSLYRFWSGDDGNPNSSGEQASFKSQKQTTDGNGHWRAGGLPPTLLDHIGFDVSHSDFVGTNLNVAGNASVEKQLRAETLKLVLNRGLNVSGFVMDENDSPVSGATVWVGRKYFRDRKETKTDSQGRFTFGTINEGETLFSASGKGFAPASKTVTVKNDMREIVFKLKPGHVVRATVQDESGSPISGVRVSLEGNPGEDSYDTYEFSATTDSDGKFQWDSAPAEPMHFYLGKQGYAAKRNVTLKPDEDNVVTLNNPRELQGLVLDANTGQPITKFSVRTGKRGGASDNQVYGIIRDHPFNSADGRFKLDLDEADENAVQVTSDDYATQVESFPAAQNGVVQVTVRMKATTLLKGIVIGPDGAPVPGASVVASAPEPGYLVQFEGRRFRSHSTTSKVATTDSDGKFSLQSPPEGGTILAAANSGFTAASVEQVRSSGVLILQPYGRIEGTLKIAGQPGVGQDVLFTLSNYGVSSDFNAYKATTDDDGKFSIENVPPGEGAIVRLIKTAPNSWTHSHNTPVNVEPGKTTRITLGDSGAVIRGSARLAAPPTDDEKLIISGRLSNPTPPLPAFTSPEQARTYMQSPEWKAQMKQRKYFGVAVNADGTFQLDSVPPGSYTLNLEARKGGERSFMAPPVATGQTSVTVPDSADPLNPINIGEILLISQKQ